MNEQTQPAALAISSADERAEFYSRIRTKALTPLWENLHALVTPSPVTPCASHLWHYDAIRADLMAAGELITAEEAVRRVLVLENPATPGSCSITQSLFSGLQLILPGEIAPSHRHTQSALRFVIEGDSAWTAVDGERTAMHPGDFIITPSWTWHDHGNDAQGTPVVWLDGLDIPLLRFLGASFAESLGTAEQQVTRAAGTSLATYGANMMPIDYRAPYGKTSPIFSYPYGRTREALATLARSAAIDPHHGTRLRYVNPATGGWAMPTIGPQMQLLPAGFAGRPHRSTAGTILSVVEGRGTATVTRGEATKVFSFGPRDTFVVPSWDTVSLAATDECVLFSFSDRPVQEALGLYRESLDA